MFIDRRDPENYDKEETSAEEKRDAEALHDEEEWREQKYARRNETDC